MQIPAATVRQYMLTVMSGLDVCLMLQLWFELTLAQPAFTSDPLFLIYNRRNTVRENNTLAANLNETDG